MDISVAMATYNGALYIKEQLDSIIPYLQENDEIIISDDGSTDETKSIIELYAREDNRIILLNGPKLGLIKNFENALLHCSKEIIMFSDQDDIWLPSKLPIIRQVFENDSNINLVHHDLYICSNKDIMEHQYRKTSTNVRRWKHGVFNNILFSVYFGCCISMRKEFIMQIVPFSRFTVAYDQLVGLMAERTNSSKFLEVPLIIRRVHGGNVTKEQPYVKRISFRFKLLASYLDTVKNLKSANR